MRVTNKANRMILVISLVILLSAQFYSINSMNSMAKNDNLGSPSLEDNYSEMADQMKVSTNHNEEDLEKQVSSLDNKDNMSTTQLVDLKPISEKIETSTITEEFNSPGRDSYIVDFGFSQSYTFTSEKKYGGSINYIEFSPSVTFELGLSIPVNITMSYNSSIEAGTTNNIEVSLFQTTAGIDFYLDVDFDIGYQYDTIFTSMKSGVLEVYQKHFSFFSTSLPLTGLGLKELRIPIPIPQAGVALTALSKILDLSIGLTPIIDVDLSADILNNNPDLSLNSQNILFEEGGSQIVQFNTDEFAEQIIDNQFSLSNFELDFNLSVDWNFILGLKGILSFLGEATLKIITFPKKLNLFTLPATGEATGTFDIIGSSQAPDFYLASYSLDDGTNNILEPGDTASVGIDLINYGKGAASQVNISTDSEDLIITETKSEFTKVRSQGGIVSHSFDTSVASGYTGRNASVLIIIDWKSTNGTVHQEYDLLTLRVLQSGDAYLNIDEYDSETNDGLWDQDEEATIKMNISKVGTAEIDYVEIHLWDTDVAGFTVNTPYVFAYGPFNTLTVNNLDLVSSSNFVESQVEVLTYVIYNLTDGTTYVDGWYLTFDLNPPSPDEHLVQVYGSLVDGINDGIFQAGETIALTAEIQNVGDTDSGYVGGLFVTNSSDLFIENKFIVWDNHSPGQTVSSLNSVGLYISEFADNSTIEFTMILIYQTPEEDLIIEEFVITIDVVALPPPELQLNYYDIYNLDDTTDFAPNKTSLVTVDISITNGPGYGGIGQLYTNNSDVQIFNDTSYYGNIYPGQNSEGNGFVVHIPANFAGGTVAFAINVTMISSTGVEYSRIGYFIIEIAAGDTIDPGYSAKWSAALQVGEEGTIVINTYDASGIYGVFLFYYNYTIDDWNYIEMSSINSTAYGVTVTLGGTGDFLFAFLVIDNANNHATAGTGDEQFTIDLIEQTTTTDTSSESSSSSSTSSSTSESSLKTNSDITGDVDDTEDFVSIFSLAIFSSLILIPIIKRYKS